MLLLLINLFGKFLVRDESFLLKGLAYLDKVINKQGQTLHSIFEIEIDINEGLPVSWPNIKPLNLCRFVGVSYCLSSTPF